jgi:hypothetical protein
MERTSLAEIRQHFGENAVVRNEARTSEALLDPRRGAVFIVETISNRNEEPAIDEIRRHHFTARCFNP